MVGSKHATAAKTCTRRSARTQTCVTGEGGNEKKLVVVVRWQGKQGGGGEGRGEEQWWVSEAHLQFKTRFGIMKM